jgi:YbgC/YbaW family acyl-CoA thioester hydrolase
MYTYKRKIRFQDTDAAGSIFFPNQFSLYQEAFESLFESIGFELSTIIQKHGYLLPVVHAEADYSSPLWMGDTVEIQLIVEHIGNSSLTFLAHFLKTNQTRAGTVKTVHVTIDGHTRKKIPLPEKLRDRLTELYTQDH